jgi:hypothetical protein
LFIAFLPLAILGMLFSKQIKAVLFLSGAGRLGIYRRRIYHPLR